MTLSVAIFSDGWEFACRHPGLMMVLIGVAGEGIEIIPDCFFRAFHKRHEKFLKLVGFCAWSVLVVGLGIELIESSKADEAVATLKERASSNEVERVRLEIRLAQLKADTLPRRIKQEQKDAFVDLLTNGVVSKCNIKVLVGTPTDRETFQFATKLREMLTEAGFGNTNDSIIQIEGLSSRVQEDMYDAPSSWVIAVCYSSTKQPLVFTGPPSVTVLTNGPDGWLYPQMVINRIRDVTNARPFTLIPSGEMARVAYFPTDDTTRIIFGVCEVLRGVGIRARYMTSDITVKPGEVALFVPPRIY